MKWCWTYVKTISEKCLVVTFFTTFFLRTWKRHSSKEHTFTLFPINLHEIPLVHQCQIYVILFEMVFLKRRAIGELEKWYPIVNSTNRSIFYVWSWKLKKKETFPEYMYVYTYIYVNFCQTEKRFEFQLSIAWSCDIDSDPWKEEIQM